MEVVGALRHGPASGGVRCETVFYRKADLQTVLAAIVNNGTETMFYCKSRFLGSYAIPLDI